MQLTINRDHQDNDDYQWYKDGEKIPNATDQNYTINASIYEQIGDYWAIINNPDIPHLTLYRDTITIILDIPEEFITDSLALIALYNSTDGPNWKNTWTITNDVIQWHGVTITDGRVTDLNLSSNSLNGPIPTEISNLTSLKQLDLSNNSLSALPLFSQFADTTPIDVTYNKLGFSTIIPNLSDQHNNPRNTNFIYAPQKPLDTRDTIIQKLNISTYVQLTINDNYQNNKYQWYKNGYQIEGAKNKDYIINTFIYEHTGNYWVRITNSNLPSLMLYRDTITILLEPVEELLTDSLALIELYDSTNGPNWKNKWNLSTNIIQWYGVTITDGRVGGLDLFDNSLTGNIPQEIDNLTNLQSLRLDNNSLSTLPSLLSIPKTASITISNNQLTFSSIVPNLFDKNDNPRENNFLYSPQTLLDTKDTIIKKLSQSIQLTINNDYESNSYQWYKDENKIQNATNKNYIIDELSYNHKGDYYVRITNTNAPNLTLHRNTITILLDISEEFIADSLTLIALYNATDGPNWNKTWNLTANVSQWYGITIYQQRVTEIDLPDNNLRGTIPQQLQNLTNLIKIDLSNNYLDSLPTINSLSSNTSIDISHNKLGFSSIIPNLKDHNDTPRDTNFIYQPQRLLEKRDILSGKENNPITLSVNDNYEGNNYQWYENRTLLKDATNRTYTIDSLDYEKHNLSNYWVILTNPILPSIQLQRNTITLLIEKSTLPNNDTTTITDIQSPSANLFTYPIQ